MSEDAHAKNTQAFFSHFMVFLLVMDELDLDAEFVNQFENVFLGFWEGWFVLVTVSHLTCNGPCKN